MHLGLLRSAIGDCPKALQQTDGEASDWSQPVYAAVAQQAFPMCPDLNCAQQLRGSLRDSPDALRS